VITTAPERSPATPAARGDGPPRRRSARPPFLLGGAGVLVAGLALLPLGYLLVRASEIGTGRVVSIATSARTLALLGSTAALAVAVTASTVAIAVPIAWVTTRTDLPLRRSWVVVSALPLAIPTYVGAYTFLAATGPEGILPQWFPDLHGFAGAWLALTLFSYPYVLLPVRAAIRRLDPSLEEASRVLGKDRFATFRRVVVPQLRPSITAGALLVALYTLSDFGAVSMMRYDTFTRAIFTQYRASLDRSVAAVLGLVLVGLTLVVLGGEGFTRRATRSYQRTHASGPRVVPVSPLGRWRWPAFGLLCLLVTVALVVPLAVIATWLVRGLELGEPLRLTTELVRNSLVASALGAAAAVIAAWPVAVLSVRRSGSFTRAVEGACWLGHSLPGIVVALSLVFFGARVVPALYQTRWMLTLAYVVLFLPQALGALRVSLLQVNPSMEAASRLLGRGPLATFRRIVLPLARPGIAAGAALVFLTCMKELPATLLLAPTGTATLATQVWTATSEAFFARAAGPALALILLSSLPMVLLVLREHQDV
jgi:iron(III) transport system permease protein